MSAKYSLCDPCLREKCTYKGTVFCCECSETLCRVCERHHKKNKASLDHNLINIQENVPERSTATNEEKYLREKSLKCVKHRSKTVKYMCKTHAAFHCDTCIKVYCNNCTLLNEHELETEMKQEFKVIKQAAEKLLEHEENFRTKLNDEERYEEIRMENLKSHIDYCFEKVKADISTETSTRRMDLKTSSLSQTEALDLIKGKITSSSYLFKSDTLQKIPSSFLLYKDVQSELLEYESMINKCTKSASSLHFSVTESVSCLDIYQRVKGCVRIHDETVDIENPFEMLPRGKFRANSVEKKAVECEKRITLPERRTSPRYCLWIGKYIIVSFQEERTLEMFDTINGTFISRYLCKSQPWAITKVDDANFAVALPYQNKITQITVRGKYMKDKDMFIPIKTSLEVSAIAYNSEDQIFYAASMNDGSRIEKFYVLGKEMGVIGIENSSGGIYNITYDSKSQYLFLSCHDADKVLCLHVNGTEQFVYSDPPLGKPLSVVLDDKDNVYITYYNGSCIHQISKKGKMKNKIVSSTGKEFVNTLGMCFNLHKNKFVLVCTNAGHMQIFKL